MRRDIYIDGAITQFYSCRSSDYCDNHTDDTAPCATSLDTHCYWCTHYK